MEGERLYTHLLHEDEWWQGPGSLGDEKARIWGWKMVHTPCQCFCMSCLLVHNVVFLHFTNNYQIMPPFEIRNGMGGKIEAGETSEEGAKRELEEESSIVSNELVRRGYLVFNLSDSKKVMKVHVYTCSDFSGDAAESEEMRPQWYDTDNIPFDKMWLDDKYWIPSMLNTDGSNPELKSFIGRFDYEHEEHIEDYSFKLV